MTIGEALHYGRLRISQSPSASRDAEILLRYAIQQSEHFCIAHTEYVLQEQEEDQYITSIEERRTGKPIAYIVHHKEFYGLDFYVNPKVLIPREETEGLITLIRDQYPTDDGGALRILDLCTGSGCVAITLQLLYPKAEIYAIDISEEALHVASRNSTMHRCSEILFYQGDLYKALPQDTKHTFDIIVSNPPYVPSSHYTEALPETAGLQFEPKIALVPNGNSASGTEIIKRILGGADHYLSTRGKLYIEISDTHAKEVLEYATQTFPCAVSRIHPDLSGRDRYLSVITSE